MTATAATLAQSRNQAHVPGTQLGSAPSVGFWLPAWSLASRELG